MKPTDETVPRDPEELVTKVRERYARIAAGESSSCCGDTSCCGDSSPSTVSREIGYRTSELDAAPGDADMGLGCGAPVAHLELQPGETVLDLGSGGGLDAALAADRVGASGSVIGVDMTPEMIERAAKAARSAGRTQVEFRQGRLESLPVDDDSVDAVTSNCVINLVPDKARVFQEIARVLRPGGRVVISDVVLDGPLPEALQRDLTAWVGCVSGAMQRDRYLDTVRSAGLTDVEVLKDVDFLAAVGDTLPEEIRVMAESSGVRPEEVAGKVRSITFRAVKP
jgi:SAM-dependent methyltransferase